ncbi:MAG: hypothetical protein K0S47_2829 [Herbinix sp.]|jgi:hypothetical protein|nr:hypothetical protein [Herbinix sp.]
MGSKKDFSLCVVDNTFMLTIMQRTVFSIEQSILDTPQKQ